MSSESVICPETVVRVSSVLNRDVKQFGKKYMFDGQEETCWNSDQGTPQWLHLTFLKPVLVEQLNVKFQGGFAGKECSIEGSTLDGSTVQLDTFYPEDVNSLQKFSLSAPTKITAMKITFQDSTDFYGRITIYHLDVVGTKPE